MVRLAAVRERRSGFDPARALWRGARRGDRLRQGLAGLGMLVAGSAGAALNDAFWDHAAAVERAWWHSYVVGLDHRCRP